MSERQNTKRVSDLEEEIKLLEKQFSKDTEEEEDEDESPVEKEKHVPETPSEDDEEPDVPKGEAEEEPEPTSPEEKTFKKRYGDLRRHFEKTKKDLEKEIEALKSAKPSASKPPLNEKELEDWMEKNKEAASLIRAIVLKENKESSSDVAKRLEEVEKMKHEVDRQRAEAVLLSTHPDFEDIRATDEFHNWAESQPQMVQDALYNNETDGKLAAWAVGLYKQYKGVATPAPKTNDKKEAARSVKSKSSSPEIGDGGKRIFKESDIKKMSDEDFIKHEKEIEQAIRDGRFVNDLTKKR